MLLITVTRPDSEKILRNMLHACSRKACAVSVFFTGRGVHSLANQDVLTALAETSECPVTSGSQTDHSRLIGEAAQVVSL